MRHARILVSTALAAVDCGDNAADAPKASDKMEGPKMAPGKMEGGKMEGGKMDDKMAPPK